jgi:hypothetical protein
MLRRFDRFGMTKTTVFCSKTHPWRFDGSQNGGAFCHSLKDPNHLKAIYWV